VPYQQYGDQDCGAPIGPALGSTGAGAALQAAWKARRGGRASPVLLVALYGQTPPFAVPLPTIRGN